MAPSEDFAPSDVRLPERWIGPEPVGARMAEVLSVEQGRLMSGTAGPRVPYGLSDLEGNEGAYLVGLQNYQGNVQMGATTRRIADPEAAFPSTTVPPAIERDPYFDPFARDPAYDGSGYGALDSIS